MRRILASSLIVLTALLAGCSDDGSANGDASTDGQSVPDGYGPLFPCDNPGGACNAHNPCAIDPICGPDKLCRPTKLQDCDDGLDCTKDICKGRGLCESVPKAGTCALPVTKPAATDGGVGKTEFKCFKKGDKKPDNACMSCDPKEDKSKWTGITGGTCDDKDSCTRDDYCQAGVCKGTDFRSKCADTYSCTNDVCDGKGGCLGHKLKSGWCLIDKTCYKDKAKDKIGCAICDASKSTTAWTPLANLCKINNKCYSKGAKHPGGCAECDPATKTTAWTVKGSYCLINNVCKNPNDKDSIKCSVCDPTKDKYGWTAIAGLCKISGSCYSKGAKHPGGCAECDPSASSTRWTVTASNSCLIYNVCKQSGDKDLSGCKSCQPSTSKYSWSTLAGLCSIDGQCYSSGATHPQSCATCDPTKSTTSWTPSGSGCVIDNTCYASGAKHPAGCGSCDPTKSKTAWTVTKTNCLIGNKCYSDGTSEPGGCGTCDSTKSATSWTRSSSCLATHLWSNSFGSTSGDYPYAVAVDANGNVYITGYFYNSINFGGSTLTSNGSYDVFIASFTPSGKHRWSKSFGSTSSDYGYALAVDRNGNVYVSGYFYYNINFGGSTLTSHGSGDIFLASFDSKGNHRWSKNFGSTSSDYGYGLAADSSGNVYLTGSYYYNVNFGGSTITSKGGRDMFVASFDSSGKHRWSKGFGSSSTDYGYGVAADGSGNIYVTGYHYSTINFGGSNLTSKGSYDVFLASFTSAGVHRWSKSFGSTSSDYGYGVAVDSSANVYIVGSFYYSIDFGGSTIASNGSRDIFLASFTPSGAHRWSKGFGSTSSDYGYGVATDSSGNVMLTGYYYVSVDFGGSTLKSKGSTDWFMASFSSSGAHRWSRSHGETSGDYGRAVACDPSGNAWFAGYFYNTVDFGGGPLSSNGSYDIGLVKIGR